MSGEDRPAKDEVLLDRALDAARAETEAGLDAMRARVVFRRVEEELAAPAPRRWLVPALSFTSAALAAGVAFFFFSAPADRTLDAADQRARVVYRSGSVAAELTEATEIAGTARIDVATDARLDFVVPDHVRVAVHGPASVSRVAGGAIAMTSGVASFSVDPHPKDAPFKVKARDAEIVVHGTKFEVEVQDGLLRQVRVAEGKVEVRPADGGPSVFLTGGSRLKDEAPPDPSRESTFDAPWWKGRHEASAREAYVHVESAPPGARVSIDGAALGATPLLVLWPSGEREVELTLDGYRPQRIKVAVGQTQIERVSVQLERLPATPSDAPEAAEDLDGAPTSRELRDPRRSAKDPWRAARSLLEAKSCTKLDRAVAGLVERSESGVDKARAEMLGAECHLRSGAKPRALAAYARISEVYADTQSAEAAMFEALKLEAELGRPTASLERVERYLTRYPAGRFAEAATMRRCESLLEMKHIGEARGCLENYRRVFPSAIRGQEAVLLLATIARIESRWAPAAELYREYLQLSPVSPDSPGSPRAEEATYQRIVCMRRGNVAAVDEVITTFLARFPESAHAAEVAKWRR